MEPLQEKCLKMAEYFRVICKQHELLYYAVVRPLDTLLHKVYLG